MEPAFTSCRSAAAATAAPAPAPEALPPDTPHADALPPDTLPPDTLPPDTLAAANPTADDLPADTLAPDAPAPDTLAPDTPPSAHPPAAAGPPALVLPERLDTAAATALAAELVSHRGTDLAIDASRVSFVGALCAQVLLAGRAAWAADGRAWTLVAPATAFIDGVRALGLPALDPTEEATG